MEEILGSPFRTSPLAVTEKPGSTSGWRLIQNCSFKDRHGVSVNDMIDSDDFQTKWGTAAEVAEIVSHPFWLDVHELLFLPAVACRTALQLGRWIYGSVPGCRCSWGVW